MFVANEISLEGRLASLAAGSEATMRALRAGRTLGLSSWCIGAGAVRNLVWDHLHGFEEPTEPGDIDLVFYDASDLSGERDASLTRKLGLLEPAFLWEVVNQASVHRWLSQSLGHEVEPFQSLVDGVVSWPEVATCVGLTLTESNEIKVIAPHGLADLFNMLVRWNPRRVPQEVYLERVAKKRFSERWPRVQVLAC